MKKTLIFLYILNIIPSVVIADMIPDNPTFKAARENLVENYIAGHGITDPQVLAAMRSVPRHCFVPKRLASKAYVDTALPIGASQTISQPYIVALMTQLAQPEPGDRALDGAGRRFGFAAGLALCLFNRFSIHVHTNYGVVFFIGKKEC